MIEQNAIITKVTITNDDHGLLSAWLILDYGGSGQGFGGYSLYSPKTFCHHNDDKGNYAGLFIWRCMEIGGVNEWSQLVGKTIRVHKESEFDLITAIGHIIKDDWFDPKKEFEELKG